MKTLADLSLLSVVVGAIALMIVTALKLAEVAGASKAMSSCAAEAHTHREVTLCYTYSSGKK